MLHPQPGILSFATIEQAVSPGTVIAPFTVPVPLDGIEAEAIVIPRLVSNGSTIPLLSRS